MKNIFLFTVIVLMTSAQAKAQVVRASGPVYADVCLVQSSNLKDLQKTLNQVGWKFVITGEVADTLAGELDPYVLGDGGLIGLRNEKGSVLVYEGNESAPVTTLISNNAKKGLKIAALNGSCLSPVKAKLQVEEMSSLASRVLGIKGPYIFLKLR